jgi:hypothetical protein
VDASYDPSTGKVTLVLTYAEARRAVDAGESLLAAMGPILAGITPPVPSRIVEIPPRKRRRYAEPASEAEALARREAVRREQEANTQRFKYVGHGQYVADDDQT